jgi:uncharacterized delta-60 repeat protein
MPKKYLYTARVAIASVFLCLAACGGGEASDGGGVVTPPPPPPPPPAGIGTAGGTVLGPNGSSVVVPSGALTNNVEIKVEQSSAGAPALPAGLVTAGAMYAFMPHGTAFSLPVTITMPFDPSLIPAGSTPALYKTNAQSQWEQVANAKFGATSVSAPVTGFSHAQVIVVPPITRNDPVRKWEFMVYSRGGAFIAPGGDGSGTQTGGLFERIVSFGPKPLDKELGTFTSSIPLDGMANGVVFGSPNGVTYGVIAEAPFGKLGGINQPGEPQPTGSSALLDQTQSFIKRAPNASLEFTLSSAEICAYDFNLFPPTFGMDDESTMVRGLLFFDVQAWTTLTQTTFFRTSGAASLAGTRKEWHRSARTFSGNTQETWNNDSFNFETENIADPNLGTGTQACLKLAGSLTYEVDLSTIAIGEEFTLRSIAQVDTDNRRGGGAIGDHQASGVYGFLRDPLEIGGDMIVFDGLEPTNRPDSTVPIQAPVAPAACVPGPGPDAAAGVLEFSTGAFTIDENPGVAPVVEITRTGGSTGAVTATFTTRDGTATGGVDYEAVNTSVYFGDGETEPRVVRIPITLDSLIEPDKTVTLTLSQPGGCAALGARSTAVLTIRSDDQPPSTGSPGALDPAFGTAGKASVPAFGGDRSAMALQPDGKIVMVGGTFADFVLARFNADGSLDTTFDADGKVTTDMVAGEQEEALAVAVQADGKIIVAGYTGTAGPGGPANFALARYNADGSLDATFGSAGKVVSGVQGLGYAVAIQSDGKIVIAGEIPLSSGADFSDFAVARYNANGTLDSTFSADGKLTTNIGGGTNTARSIALQPDGAILVSGEPVGVFTGSDHTDVVKYDGSGVPDSGFGTGGMLTLGGARVGEGLAVQGDGKLVMVGSVDVGVAPAVRSQFAVRRLNANGTPDTAFGTAGAVSTPFTDRGDSAFAVTLQVDGRIIVAGRSSSQSNPDFAVARYNRDGTLDTTFANAGKQTVDFFGFNDIAESVAIQADGGVLLGGLARNSVDGYGLARVFP